MANMVEIRLLTLTCEFAGDDGDDLELAGVLRAETFDTENAIKTSNVIFDFPNGPIRLRKGESANIDQAVRVALRSPLDDPPDAGELFVRFGDDLIEKDTAPDTDDSLGTEWQILHVTQIINPEPFIWHLYFGRSTQVARADISSVFAHPL
jgi:hypothetical protein